MKLLSKTAWRMFTKAISRACPKYSQRIGGFKLEAMEGRTLLSAGLDPHFGSGGIALADFGGSDQGYAMAVQNDGKVLMAGRAWNVNQYDFGVVRFNTDGSLDTSFGTGGMVMTDLGSQFDAAYAMAVQTNGKIVVVGQTEGVGYDFGMVRYNTDGTLDTNFGTDGMVVSDLGMDDETIRALTMDGNGNILAAGNGGGDYLVARYSSTGQLDSSFGNGGKVFVDFVGGYDVAHAVAVSGDKIMVAGMADMIGDMDMGVVSLNADGSANTDFCNNGVLALNLGSWDDEATG